MIFSKNIVFCIVFCKKVMYYTDSIYLMFYFDYFYGVKHRLHTILS